MYYHVCNEWLLFSQSKLPNYQRVYDNVDRDEVSKNLIYSLLVIHVTGIQDDEIDINELDFALKAVNYDLISDAELEYVNQVTILP